MFPNTQNISVWFVHSTGWELQLFSSDENVLVWKLLARSLLVVWWLAAYSYWQCINMSRLSVSTCNLKGCCRSTILWCNVAWNLSFPFPWNIKATETCLYLLFYFKLPRCKLFPLIRRKLCSACLVLMKFGCSKLDHNWWQMYFILPFKMEQQLLYGW